MSDHFESQIEQYLSGAMNASDYERLAHTLRDEPDRIDDLLDQIEMDILLDDWGASRLPQRTSAGQSPRRRTFRSYRRLCGNAVALGCYAVVCLVAILCTHWFSEKTSMRYLLAQSLKIEKSEISAFDTEAVARIGKTYNVKWKEPDRPLREGELIFQGVLSVESGVFSLQTSGGVELVVEGPASLEIDADERLTCRSGRFYFRLSSRPSSREIMLPHATLYANSPSGVSQDVVFAVYVRDNSSEVHLFRNGTVRLTTTATDRRNVLQPETAVSVDYLGNLSRIETDQNEFIDFQELKRLQASLNWERYDQWKGEIENAAADPSLAFVLDLDDGAYPGMLPGHGPRSSLSRQWGCMEVPGRFRINKGLLFFGSFDSLDMSVPLRLSSFTITASVRMATDDPQGRSLFASEGLCWEIDSDGFPTLEINDENHRQFFRGTEAIPREILDCWLHLAVVVDPANNSVRHYLDGREILSDVPLDPMNIWFGKSGIGGWTGRGRTRCFKGCVDEFRLYDRALSLPEINRVADLRPTF